MTARYAANTQVPLDRSRAEIERTLTRYGATSFGYMSGATESVIVFEIDARRVMFRMPMPERFSRQFTHTDERGVRRKPETAQEIYEQALRQRWRALALVIKAKLEAVQAGITTVEQEFLAHIVLPDGHTTVGQWLAPQLAEAYAGSNMPALISVPGGSR